MQEGGAGSGQTGLGAALDRLPLGIVPVVLGAMATAFTVAAWLWPAFYDHFLWPYFSGPIVAEAHGLPPTHPLYRHGVAAHSGYNVVNTLAWGALLAACMLWLVQLLRRYRSPVDLSVVAGGTLWIVVGTLAHVLEDAGLFRPPLQYLFISPPIYLVFGALGVTAYLMGHRMHRSEARAARWPHRPLALALAAATIGYALLVWTRPPVMAGFVSPAWWALAAVAVWVAASRLRLRQSGTHPATILILTGLGTSFVALVYLASYVLAPWQEPVPLRWWAWAAPALAAVVLCALWAIGRSQTRWSWAHALVRPANLLLVGSQLLDALATALAVDIGRYQEKHVIPLAVMDLFRHWASGMGWTWGAEHAGHLAFVPLKLGLALGAVFLLDRGKRPGEADTPFMGIIKLGIILGGIGPGLRGFLRLFLGV